MGFGRIALIVAGTAIAVTFLPSLFKQKLPKVVNGYTAKGWEKVGEVFKKHVEDGMEKGAAFAVYHKGELVVEYSGGYADEEAEVPWNKDTINCFYSSTKGVSAIIIAMLVDRGLIEYDKPVATYWPEFAQNGKEKITVRQILSHTAGLAWYDEPTTVMDIVKNPKKMSDALAKQKPNWEPGTQHGYHAITLGLYIDQLVRRVDPKHRDISQFFREEVALPHGIEFYIGLPLELNYRCTRVVAGSMWNAIRNGEWALMVLLFQIATGRGDFNKVVANPAAGKTAGNPYLDPAIRAVPCGASRGFGTAVGLAKLYSLVASGKIVSRTVLDDMLILRAGPGPDRIIPLNITYASGVNILPSKLGSVMFGTPGAGGQMGFGDIEHQLAWAYSTNYHEVVSIHNDRRWLDMVEMAYDVIKEKEKKKKSK